MTSKEVFRKHELSVKKGHEISPLTVTLKHFLKNSSTFFNENFTSQENLMEEENF